MVTKSAALDHSRYYSTEYRIILRKMERRLSLMVDGGSDKSTTGTVPATIGFDNSVVVG